MTSVAAFAQPFVTESTTDFVFDSSDDVIKHLKIFHLFASIVV